MNHHLRFETLHQSLAQDRDFISAKSAFKRAKKLEAHYGARLRQVARNIGDIVRTFYQGSFASAVTAQAQLHRYADLLHPWAEAVGDRMVKEVAASDRQAWRKMSGEIGRALHIEIETAPTGQVMRDALARQVTLITSLPRGAANRVHKLTTEAVTTGRRADDIAKEIMRTGEVTKSRANLIAATEVARTSASLTEARARSIGSVSYIWRTVGDGSVRHDHKILNGRSFDWDAPPVSDQRTGERAHPGCIYGCRCYAEPLLID